MKKLNLLLATTTGVALAMAFYPQAFAADTGSCGENCTWTFDSGTLKISGTGAMDNYSYSNQPWKNYNIDKLSVGEGITNIGSAAFFCKNNITSVELPSTLKTIGGEAFRGTSPLSYVKIPEGVTSIGTGAFSSSGAKIEIPASVTTIGGWALENVQEIIVTANENLTFDAGIFSSCCGGPYSLQRTKISCKGATAVCEKMFQKAIDYGATIGQEPNIVPYVARDNNNNIIEEWNGNNKLTYVYDSGNNLTAVYENGVATYRRTSYTPTEAAKAVKKGNNNKITFTFK